MAVHAHIARGALFIAVALALAACTKQDDQAGAAAPAAASAPAFPTGNEDKQMTAADCDKLPDPKPADDSAAGRAAAVGQGQAARAACKKDVAARQPNADLARIREIKENEEAERLDRKKSEAEWRQGVKEGSKKPIKQYTY